MSEARKKLKKEEWWYTKQPKSVRTAMLGKDVDRIDTLVRSGATPEQIQTEINKVKEEIKRKKEELRFKREEGLAVFKNRIRHMIDDEDTGIAWYKELIEQASKLGITENVRDLQNILNDEQRHLSLLKSMMGTWITHGRVHGSRTL